MVRIKDKKDLWRALNTLTHGAYVITASHDGKINGMTAAWACQISFEPPMMCVSIAPKRHTFKMIKESGHFGVCVLNEDQKDISKFFGTTSGSKIDKFENYRHTLGEKGVPLLDDCRSTMVCKVDKLTEAGDHFVITGKVIDAEIKNTDKRPLVYNKSDYW